MLHILIAKFFCIIKYKTILLSFYRCFIGYVIQLAFSAIVFYLLKLYLFVAAYHSQLIITLSAIVEWTEVIHLDLSAVGHHLQTRL